MSSMRCFVLIIVSMFVVSETADAQTLPAGGQVLTFYSTVDDTDQPYAVYIPQDFDEDRAYPLVISLHGAGSNHRLNLRRVFGKSNAPGQPDVEASRMFPEWKDVEYIVASPFARGTMGYQGVAEKDVLDVLEDVKRRFLIDEDRVYLTGLSMGGGGTLWLGLSRPDLWAAIAPVCPSPPAGIDALAGNALNLPVHFFHGDSDPVVPVEVSRSWVRRLRDMGGFVEYEEYPGVGHNSWDAAYADAGIFAWFDQFERNRYPARVRYTTDRYAHDRAYWIRIDRLVPGMHAHIDARFESKGVLHVTTDSLEGFSLFLAGHPQRGDEVTRVVIDGIAFALEGDTLSFHRINGAWAVGRFPVNYEPAKRRGLEGPMSRVVAGRHVYVYGTQGQPSREDQEKRLNEAVEAGTWSDYRGWFLNRVMVFPRIIADTDVQPSDLETGNLVLLGTPSTNGVLADMADGLPFHLEADPSRYGLTYVYPVDGRYVLVSSGVPWWRFDIDPKSDGLDFKGAIPPLMLSDTDDFILWDDHNSRVVARGRFDEKWGVPPEVEEAMRGVVRIIR